MEIDLSQILIIIGFIIYMIYSISSGLRKYNQSGNENIPPYGEPNKKPFNQSEKTEEESSSQDNANSYPDRHKETETYRKRDYWDQKADDVVEAEDFLDNQDETQRHYEDSKTYRKQNYWDKYKKPDWRTEGKQKEKSSRHIQDYESYRKTWKETEYEKPATSEADRPVIEDQNKGGYTMEDYNEATSVEDFFERRRRERQAHINEKIEDKDVKEGSPLKEYKGRKKHKKASGYKGYSTKAAYYSSILTNRNSFRDAFVVSEILERKYD